MVKFSHDWIECVVAGFAAGVVLGAMLVGEDWTGATLGVTCEVVEGCSCPSPCRDGVQRACDGEVERVLEYPKLSVTLIPAATEKGVAAVFCGRMLAPMPALATGALVYPLGIFSSSSEACVSRRRAKLLFVRRTDSVKGKLKLMIACPPGDRSVFFLTTGDWPAAVTPEVEPEDGLDDSSLDGLDLVSCEVHSSRISESWW